MKRQTNTDQVKVSDRQASGSQPDNSTPTGTIDNGGTGGPPTGPAGGDLAGTYPNPTLKVIGAAAGPIGDATHVAQVTIDAKGRVTGLASVAITYPPSSTQPNTIVVTDAPYSAVGDGITDDTVAITAAIAACRFAGGIDRVIMQNYGTGYTSVPTVSFVGGFGSGEAATALVADVGANGEVGSVTISARGTAHKILGKQCGITSGNATVTCADTSGLVNGVSFQHYTVPYGTTISSFVANTSITLSAAPTASNAFAQAAIGIPFVVFTGGGGSGAAGDVIVTNGAKLVFPPGAYLCTGFDITGFHNLTIEGYGAALFINNVNATGLVIEEFSSCVEVRGLRILHLAAVFGNSATRDFGCGLRIAGNLVTIKDCEAYNSPEFGILFGRDRNTGTASYGCRLINWRAIQTCGDGIHASNGCGQLDISGYEGQSNGDDSIGIVADYGSGNQPSNITINGYHIRNGGWRGIAIMGAINVQVGPGIIHDVENYAIEVGAGAGVNAADVSLVGFHILRSGSGGPGEVVANRHGIVVENASKVRLGPGFIDTTTGYGYYIANVTDVQADMIMVLNAPSGDFGLGGGLTRLSQTYRAAGAFTYRGEGGTVTTIAPS